MRTKKRFGRILKSSARRNKELTGRECAEAHSLPALSFLPQNTDPCTGPLVYFYSVVVRVTTVDYTGSKTGLIDLYATCTVEAYYQKNQENDQ